MYLHDPMEDDIFPAHLEFPTYATWVCALDSGHTELLARMEWFDIRRVHNLRKK